MVFKSLVFMILWVLMPTAFAHSVTDKFVISFMNNTGATTAKRLLLEIKTAVNELSATRQHIEIIVVAHHDGVQALRTDDYEARAVIKALQKKHVTFKAGRMSMDGWGLTDDNMPVDIEIVPCGLSEIMRLERAGYILMPL